MEIQTVNIIAQNNPMLGACEGSSAVSSGAGFIDLKTAIEQLNQNANAVRQLIGSGTLSPADKEAAIQLMQGDLMLASELQGDISNGAKYLPSADFGQVASSLKLGQAAINSDDPALSSLGTNFLNTCLNLIY